MGRTKEESTSYFERHPNRLPDARAACKHRKDRLNNAHLLGIFDSQLLPAPQIRGSERPVRDPRVNINDL